ncbi:MAG: two-component sensor histidine kinase [Acidobacteria bacterium]|nr:MAG: two-component sensor histidine kinase [Acidobacteriota bacterium]
MFAKLLVAFLLVIAATTVTLDLTLRRDWENSLLHEITGSLTQKTRLFAARVQHDKSVPLAQLVKEEAGSAEARATVIDASGKVLADSDANPQTMENHATRPEFIAALHGQTGSNVRTSHTLGIDFLYVAAPIPGGAVRLAYPLASVQEAMAQVQKRVLWASLLAVLVATVLAGVMAHSIARRLRRVVLFAEQIAAGNLSARVAESSTDEIGKVASALDHTARQWEESFTALERSRSELETLLNSIQDAVVAVAADRRLQWVNGTMLRLLGRNVRVGSPLTDAVRDPGVLRAIEESISSHQVRSARAVSLFPGRTFSVTAAPMPGGGAVAVLHDITEIERIEKTRRDFIANVSHELRTPLTSVQGYTETLLDTVSPSDSRVREFLEIIRKNSDRMARLTNDLLTLARVESGEQKMEVQPVQARALLEDAITNFRDLAQGMNLGVQLEECPPVIVAADRHAIQQVFSNLLENAMKYAHSGSQVSVGARETAGGAEFYVRDFGPGIASEHLPRIFERFYRVDKARSKETGGTGLGLAIVKHIILNHGGKVRVESQLNHGSTFFFTLPGSADELPLEEIHDKFTVS